MPAVDPQRDDPAGNPPDVQAGYLRLGDPPPVAAAPVAYYPAPVVAPLPVPVPVPLPLPIGLNLSFGGVFGGGHHHGGWR